jgi:hypothetical protein
MRHTIVGIFETPLRANETLHLLERAGFAAERIPRPAKQRVRAETRSFARRLADAVSRKLHAFMDVDLDLSPFATALAQGRFVIKVYVSGDPEADAARRILEASGAREIDSLADE